MAFLGSFSGSRLIKGMGAYHPGAITIDIPPTSAVNSVVATSAVSTTATGSTNPLAGITKSSVSVSPRTSYDPFGTGTITYSVVAPVASGTITQVQGNKVYISFSSGAFANLALGMPIKIAGWGASQGGGMYGQFYITSIVSASGYITLASSYANYLTSTSVTFASSSAGNASGYTWTPATDYPTWSAGGGLPPGITMSSAGAITGSYTINQSASAGINPSQSTLYAGTNGSYPNYYAAQLQSTNANGFVDPNVETFNVQITVPYEFRQILTTCYTIGGYASSVPFTNVNRCTTSTDTNVDLPSGRLTTSQAYQFGVWSWNYSYCMGANNSVSTASNTTIAWNMRTETSRTTNFNTTWYDSVNSNACVQQEHYYGWITAGTTIREFNLSTETNNGTPANQTGAGASASGGSHETYGIFNSSNVAWTYATRTGTARTSGLMSQSANAKIMQNKNPTTNQWGNRGSNLWSYTNFPTNTTTNSALAVPGAYGANEENHTNGQDWGYCIGFYNGAHVATSYKWTFASQTGATGTSNYQGQTGNSSAWPANRD